MRESYLRHLETLHTELVRMGALCEEAIGNAVKGLLEDDGTARAQAIELEDRINQKEREIESFCVKLLLLEQPVAGDLRRVTAALKMITDMERIGDQAADIAEISAFMADSPVKRDVHIEDMTAAATKMLTDSVDSFVEDDIEKALGVIADDDIVDGLFDRIRGELIGVIMDDGSKGRACLDILMIAKYLERIGDHAENIAESVVYSING
ncbi:MAG: phosphate signaling complex protein PhoU [Clostridiales Family XIII bacterium]|jgi:phosphate transport system protein|nr:phosphate signaling complex protein PhoU [Clostridiales Family XIII bacterium]